MPELSDSEASPTTYATAEKLNAYFDAMSKLQNRRSSRSVRLYVSAPPDLQRSPKWPARIERLQRHFPGAKLLKFNDLFLPYEDGWREAAPTFDGMIVFGTRRKRQGHVFLVGDVARREVIDMLRRRRPVLLHAQEFDLVPLVDCKTHDIGEARVRMKVTVPSGWNPRRRNQTLRATLRALRSDVPAVAADRAQQSQSGSNQLFSTPEMD
ncbi:hypothetical protein ACFWNG_23190 [Streptomyces sp. NPDC058391]|uniref:hypothetical protein n=1 Tax=Streptomyces sp. NPDC058391 TaxID=3346476 RepID=UPI003659B783